MVRFSVFIGFLTVVNLDNVLGDDPQLRIVSCLFRHGDRTPDTHETFPTDEYANYSYSPVARGGLTNSGKQREYHLGQMLRSWYDDFLGPSYKPSIVEARSTDFDRTKMSLQLVLAALFPPSTVQIWNKTILWQPIPTTYRRIKEDYLLRSGQCPRYAAELKSVLSSTDVKQRTAKFKSLMGTIGKLTGKPINDIMNLYELYLTFAAQSASGLELPKWVYDYWPNGQLLDAAETYYETRSYNDALKRLGMMLNKILGDAVLYRNGTLDKPRQLYLYSGHEVNIASVQKALGVYEPHVPAYSSAVIFEFWELNGEFFFKVFYYKGIPSDVVAQRIPGCSEFCPMDRFLKLLKPVTATASDLKCE